MRIKRRLPFLFVGFGFWLQILQLLLPGVLGLPLDITIHARALDGLIDTLDSPRLPNTIAEAQQEHPTHLAQANGPNNPSQTIPPGYPGYESFHPVFTPAPGSGPSVTLGLGSSLSGTNVLGGSHPTSILNSQPTPTIHSVIGTIPPLPSRSSFVPTPRPSPTSSATADGSQPDSDSSLNGGKDKDDTSTGLNRWKIIGVGVISFGVVIALLLLSIFFDAWWRFLKDLINNWKFKRSSRGGNGDVLGGGRLGRGGKRDFEELVPDWEKASWEIRVESDRERYPSFSSLPQGLQRSGSTTNANTNANVNVNHLPPPPPPTHHHHRPGSQGSPALNREHSRREVRGLGLGTERAIGTEQKEMDITSQNSFSGYGDTQNQGWIPPVYTVPPKAILEHSAVPSIPASKTTTTTRKSPSTTNGRVGGGAGSTKVNTVRGKSAMKKSNSRRREGEEGGDNPFEDPKYSACNSVYGGIA